MSENTPIKKSENSDASDKKQAIVKNKSKGKSKDTTIINWNSDNYLSDTNRPSEYLKVNGLATSATENSAKIVVPKSGKLSKLVVQLVTNNVSGNVSPGANVSRTFIVRKNGIDTSVRVTITGDDTRGQSTRKIRVKKFDLISLSHTIDTHTQNNAIGIASIILSS